MEFSGGQKDDEQDSDDEWGGGMNIHNIMWHTAT